MNQNFSASWFFKLENTLRERGLDSDSKSFDEIREMLAAPERLSPDSFAYECAYVILAGGFSQKTAKKIHKIICDALCDGAGFDDLLKLFNNKNKINAICKIWNNRKDLCEQYYAQKTLDDKLNFIQTLPHIGKITAHHLARNLGENIVKYDVWIQRLGVLYAGNPVLFAFVDNGKLNPEIKKYCDDMFSHLEQETKFPIGYIDVVLWKACQNGLIQGLKDGC